VEFSRARRESALGAGLLTPPACGAFVVPVSNRQWPLPVGNRHHKCGARVASRIGWLAYTGANPHAMQIKREPNANQTPTNR